MSGEPLNLDSSVYGDYEDYSSGFSFTTGIRPYITSFAPANGAAGVSAFLDFSLTFSEDVNYDQFSDMYLRAKELDSEGAVVGTYYFYMDESEYDSDEFVNVEFFDANGSAATVGGSDVRRVEISSSSSREIMLQESTAYRIEFSGLEVLRDLSGDSLTLDSSVYGDYEDYSWGAIFTTGTHPYIIATTPVSDAVGVSNILDFSLTFSEDMSYDSLLDSEYTLSGGGMSIDILLSSALSNPSLGLNVEFWAANGSAATVGGDDVRRLEISSSTIPLSGKTEYEIELTVNTARGAGGMLLNLGEYDSGLTFTTAPRPYIVSTFPKEGELEISIFITGLPGGPPAGGVIEFSEDMNYDSLLNSILTLSELDSDGAVVDTFSISVKAALADSTLGLEVKFLTQEGIETTGDDIHRLEISADPELVQLKELTEYKIELRTNTALGASEEGLTLGEQQHPPPIDDYVLDLVNTDYPYNLVMHNDHLYWATWSRDTYSYRIQRSDLNGNDIITLVDVLEEVEAMAVSN